MLDIGVHFGGAARAHPPNNWEMPMHLSVPQIWVFPLNVLDTSTPLMFDYNYNAASVTSIINWSYLSAAQQRMKFRVNGKTLKFSFREDISYVHNFLHGQWQTFEGRLQRCLQQSTTAAELEKPP